MPPISANTQPKASKTARERRAILQTNPRGCLRREMIRPAYPPRVTDGTRIGLGAGASGPVCACGVTCDGPVRRRESATGRPVPPGAMAGAEASPFFLQLRGDAGCGGSPVSAHNPPSRPVSGPAGVRATAGLQPRQERCAQRIPGPALGPAGSAGRRAAVCDERTKETNTRYKSRLRQRIPW